jgi:hypothetical protein
VSGFYTRGFRDLIFSNDPPPRLFRAVTTVMAGYWRPRWPTRAWLWLFFLIARMQGRIAIVPSHLGPASEAESAGARPPGR